MYNDGRQESPAAAAKQPSREDSRQISRKKAPRKQMVNNSSHENSYQFQSSKEEDSINGEYDSKLAKKYVKSNTKGSQGRMSRTSNERSSNNIVQKDDSMIKKYKTQMRIEQDDEDMQSQKSS